MLTVWHPNRIFSRGRHSFGGLLDDLFDETWPGVVSAEQSIRPAVDLKENDDNYELHADLPGVNEEDIKVTLEDGVLTVSAKREESQEESRDGYHMRERRYGTFSRSFRLGSGVNSEGVEASYKKGVLEVRLPKTPESQPQQIPVSVN